MTHILILLGFASLRPLLLPTRHFRRVLGVHQRQIRRLDHHVAVVLLHDTRHLLLVLLRTGAVDRTQRRVVVRILRTLCHHLVYGWVACAVVVLQYQVWAQSACA